MERFINGPPAAWGTPVSHWRNQFQFPMKIIIFNLGKLLTEWKWQTEPVDGAEFFVNLWIWTLREAKILENDNRSNRYVNKWARCWSRHTWPNEWGGDASGCPIIRHRISGNQRPRPPLFVCEEIALSARLLRGFQWEICRCLEGYEVDGWPKSQFNRPIRRRVTKINLNSVKQYRTWQNKFRGSGKTLQLQGLGQVRLTASHLSRRWSTSWTKITRFLHFFQN